MSSPEPVLKTVERSAKRWLYSSVLSRLFYNRPIPVPLHRSEIRHILIVRRDVIGDMILTTPFFNLLFDSLPNASLSLICSPSGYEVIRYDTRFKETVIYDGSAASLISLLGRPREEYDLAIALSLNGVTHDALLLNTLAPNAIKASYAIGNPLEWELYQSLYNLHLHIDSRLPLWKQLIEFGETLFGFRYSEQLIRQSVPLSAQISAYTTATLNAQGLIGTPFMFFNLSARKEVMQWGIKNSRDFLSLFFERYSPYPVFLSASPTEFSELMQLMKMFKNEPIYALPRQSSLQHVAGYLSHASCVVTPDTSIAHLAATYHCPTFILSSDLASNATWAPCNEAIMLYFAAPLRPVRSISPDEAFRSFIPFFEAHCRRAKDFASSHQPIQGDDL